MNEWAAATGISPDDLLVCFTRYPAKTCHSVRVLPSERSFREEREGRRRAGAPAWSARICPAVLNQEELEIMRAMRAEGFRGYQDLKLVDTPKPQVSDGRVLVKITAAGVTPLEHTICREDIHERKRLLVLGSEGAGVVEDANASEFSVGARVMFTGPYGVSEDGAYSEYLAVRKENLSLIPGNIDDVSAAGLPVAYLTAHMALSLAGFQAGKTVLSPAIGGSVGNAVTQLARALGARHAFRRPRVMQRRNKPAPWAFMRSSIFPQANSARAFAVSRRATVRIL